MIGKTKTKARVVDGKLIVSCPGAISPVVWQMDLMQVQSSAFEVQESAEKFSLVFKQPDGSVAEIAPFTRRKEAVAALMATSRAMEEAQGQIRAGTSLAAMRPQKYAARKKRSLWGGLAWVGSVVIAAFILVMVIGAVGTAVYFPKTSGVENMGIEPLAGDMQPQASEPSSGVPLSADEYLKGR